ncbi:MAG: sugar phosphate isomerase/epimerase family protein [Ilyomonas sp.]
MITRRTFLKQSGLVSAGLLLKPEHFAAKQQLIGLQLYTVRNEVVKDVPGTIEKVAQIGYNSLEVFGYGNGKFFGLTPEEFLAILKKNNIVTPSGHYSVNKYLSNGDEDELKHTIEDAAKMGHTFFTIPFLTPNLRKSLDDYKTLADRLNKAAPLVKDAGMKLAYHNHDFEFKDWGNGETGYSILSKQTDPKMVSFEMDIYWVSRAGKDPIALMKEQPGRFKMWHVKDMANTAEKEFTEVGSGTINYKEIFKYKKLSGMEYFFVEQDQVKIPVYESIAKSYNYVKNNLVS